MDRHKGDAVSITSARPGRSVDLHNRQTRYLVSMLIRTLCFLAAVVASGPLRWVFVTGAVFLPYVAVVLANTGSNGEVDDPDVYTPEPMGELGAGDTVDGSTQGRDDGSDGSAGAGRGDGPPTR